MVFVLLDGCIEIDFKEFLYVFLKVGYVDIDMVGVFYFKSKDVVYCIGLDQCLCGNLKGFFCFQKCVGVEWYYIGNYVEIVEQVKGNFIIWVGDYQVWFFKCLMD